jgi:hypothetical protein
MERGADPSEFLAVMSGIHERASLAGIPTSVALQTKLVVNGIQDALPHAYASCVHMEELYMEKVEGIMRRESIRLEAL